MTDQTKTLFPIWLNLGLAIVPVIAALLFGQWATYPNILQWYPALLKPHFNPPNWVFAPVWTGLYGLMIYSVWRILKVPAEGSGRSAALALFYGQLAFNALWPWMFFGLASPLAGLINIVPQWLLIMATIHRFRRADVVAAICLLPLAAWVGFAIALNFEIWRLNG
ncbi:TspO/MBR family protein [Rhizobium rhizogenes]